MSPEHTGARARHIVFVLSLNPINGDVTLPHHDVINTPVAYIIMARKYEVTEPSVSRKRAFPVACSFSPGSLPILHLGLYSSYLLVSSIQVSTLPIARGGMYVRSVGDTPAPPLK